MKILLWEGGQDLCVTIFTLFLMIKVSFKKSIREVSQQASPSLLVREASVSGHPPGDPPPTEAFRSCLSVRHVTAPTRKPLGFSTRPLAIHYAVSMIMLRFDATYSEIFQTSLNTYQLENYNILLHYRRSQWPRGLRRRSSAARLLRLSVRIPPGAWMFVCCECCVLSGRGLCDGLITRPGESQRLWRVVVCDQETSKTRRLKPATGL